MQCHTVPLLHRVCLPLDRLDHVHCRITHTAPGYHTVTITRSRYQTVTAKVLNVYTVPVSVQNDGHLNHPPVSNYGRVRVTLTRAPADQVWQRLHRPLCTWSKRLSKHCKTLSRRSRTYCTPCRPVRLRKPCRLDRVESFLTKM